MDYAKVVPLVEFTARAMGAEPTNEDGRDDELDEPD
jgi:hypothetical protein